MYNRMRQAPPLQQIVIVFMALLAVVFALKIVLGLVKLAIPLLILAALRPPLRRAWQRHRLR